MALRDIEWTEEMDREVREHSSTWGGFTALASKLGMNRVTVQRRANALGVITPMWDDEQIRILKEEWAKGSTGTEIARMINKTRNAVIGKARRMGLEERAPRNQHHSSTPAGKLEPKKKRVRKPAKRVDEIALKAKQEGGRNAPVFYPAARPLTTKPPISIMELKMGTCRAVVGKAPDGLATYCGDDVFPGKSFCPGHCAMYFAPPKERRFA